MATIDWCNFDTKNLRFDQVINTKGGRTVPIHYDNDGTSVPIRVQTPRAVCPFEIAKPYEKDGKKSWSIALSFGPDYGNNTKMKAWFNFHEQLDHAVVDEARRRFAQWFGGMPAFAKATSDDVHTRFTDSIHFSIDKETGQRTEKYAPHVKAKIPLFKEVIKAEFFDNARPRPNLISIEDVKPQSEVGVSSASSSSLVPM